MGHSSDMVKDVWESVDDGGIAMERWQNKVRRLRQFLRGWAKNVSGHNKKEKKDLLDKLDALDKKAEMSPLSTQELDIKNYMSNRLASLLREE